MKKERAISLDMRRAKLAELLLEEEKLLEHEFICNLETPEQVRKKMGERLHYLQEKREEERKRIVEQKMEMRFKEETDDLRKLESNNFTIECKLTNEQQMLEKYKLRQREIEEEMLHSELWTLDYKKKIEKEKQELEEQTRKKQEQIRFLNWQKEQRALLKDEELNKLVQEKKMLQTQWQQELDKAKKDEIQKRINEINLHKEIINYNKKEKEIKDGIVANEKLMDKEMIQRVIEMEKEQESNESKEKERQKLANKEFFKYVNDKTKDFKQEEKVIEHLTALELEKQQKKEDEKWEKEQQARIQLMTQVYDDRAKAIELKSNIVI
jgi:hypothetical protein